MGIIVFEAQYHWDRLVEFGGENVNGHSQTKLPKLCTIVPVRRDFNGERCIWRENIMDSEEIFRK